MRRRVTFSTLSLSRTCRCYCKYCSARLHEYGHQDFISHAAWTYEQALERAGLARLRETIASLPQPEAA